MAPEREPSRTVGRKLTKRRKPERHPSVQYPESLKEGDDVQEDVTAAKGQSAQCTNQSVFSMIAAARSKVDFNARFDDDSSGSEEEPENSAIVEKLVTTGSPGDFAQERQEALVDEVSQSRAGRTTHHDGRPRLLPKLKLRTKREKDYMSQSVLPQPHGHIWSAESSKGPLGNTPRDAPVMSRMLEAQAKLGSCMDLSNPVKDVVGSHAQKEASREHTTLVTRLMEIFGFDAPEEVIAGGSKNTLYITVCTLIVWSEYPCWLLQSVLLQGYLYITQFHISFYAYLPKKSVSLTRSTRACRLAHR